MPTAYVFPLNSRFNSVISFHSFPLNKETRKTWLQNIRREDCKVSPNTRVCSRHFRTDDFIEQSTPTSRRLLKKGAVPTLFTRNNNSNTSAPKRTGLWRRRRVPSPLKQDPVPTGFQHQEHDYCSSLIQDHLEVDEAEVLRKEVERLKRQVAELSVLQRFYLGRFKIKCHKCTKSTFSLLFLNTVRTFTSCRLFTL
uniref:THAP domain-containing protein 1 n=1 Tax=Sinocyclocheilus anshuiensis TaxID=1608454 RepID=A0A671NHE3_9TELE